MASNDIVTRNRVGNPVAPRVETRPSRARTLRIQAFERRPRGEGDGRSRAQPRENPVGPEAIERLAIPAPGAPGIPPSVGSPWLAVETARITAPPNGHGIAERLVVGLSGPRHARQSAGDVCHVRLQLSELGLPQAELRVRQDGRWIDCAIRGCHVELRRTLRARRPELVGRVRALGLRLRGFHVE